MTPRQNVLPDTADSAADRKAQPGTPARPHAAGTSVGPDRPELWFRLIFSLAGLALLAGAVAYRGIPQGPAFFEVILVAGGFFGGTLIWTALKLFRGASRDG